MNRFDASQVYMPAEDTFLLERSALLEVCKTDRVLEMGTGSGRIAASVQTIAPYTLAIDINPHAAAYAREINGVETLRGDMFTALSPVAAFDLILFNAPYLPTEPEDRMNDWLEYALDGGRTGRAVLERFLPAAVPHLTKTGRILLLISSLTGLAEVQEMCRTVGCRTEIIAQEKEEDAETLYVLRISRACQTSDSVYL